MSDDSKEYTVGYTQVLEKPIQLGDLTIEKLVYNKELTVGDMEDFPIQNQKMSDFIRPISRVTGQTTKAIRAMSFKDMQKSIEVVTSFLGLSQEDGEEA